MWKCEHESFHCSFSLKVSFCGICNLFQFLTNLSQYYSSHKPDSFCSVVLNTLCATFWKRSALWNRKSLASGLAQHSLTIVMYRSNSQLFSNMLHLLWVWPKLGAGVNCGFTIIEFTLSDLHFSQKTQKCNLFTSYTIKTWPTVLNNTLCQQLH